MKKAAKFLSVGTKDVIKGFILAVISAILTGMYTWIQQGTFPPDIVGWQSMGVVSLGSGLSYLLKNIFTNSHDQFLKAEPIPNEVPK